MSLFVGLFLPFLLLTTLLTQCSKAHTSRRKRRKLDRPLSAACALPSLPVAASSLDHPWPAPKIAFKMGAASRPASRAPAWGRQTRTRRRCGTLGSHHLTVDPTTSSNHPSSPKTSNTHKPTPLGPSLRSKPSPQLHQHSTPNTPPVAAQAPTTVSFREAAALSEAVASSPRQNHHG